MRVLSLKNKFLAALLGVWLVEDQSFNTAYSEFWPFQAKRPSPVEGWLEQIEAGLAHPIGFGKTAGMEMPATAIEPEAALIYSVPTLLRWHDHAQQRQIWISSLPLSSAIQDNVWLLGHILEYLLGTSEGPQSLSHSLATYLTQQYQQNWPRYHPPIENLMIEVLRSPAPVALTRDDNRPVTKSGESPALAVALQSFLTVPESYGLAVNNALRSYGLLPAMLTGLMVGAYGGVESLPIQWLLTANLKRIEHLSTQLFAQWAGQNTSVDWNHLSLSSQMVGALTL